MWTEWLGRTLGARSAEDYVRRRARRYANGTGPAGDLDAEEGEATLPDAAAPYPPRDGYG